LQIIDIVKSTGVYVGLSTNGVFIDRQIEALSKLDYITFSLDSFDKYDLIRVGEKKEGFKLAQKIKDFLPIAYKNKISIDVQFIELEGFREQVKKAEDFFRGEDIIIRTIENGYAIHFFPDIQNPVDELCVNPWISASIQCTGEVTSCCFSMGDDIKFGNLKNQTLKEIWAGEEVQKLRWEHRTKSYRSLCRKCFRRSPTLFHWKLYSNAIKNRKFRNES
jgi:radical SAM protein with 4Fe4S-binding SPASM domain